MYRYLHDDAYWSQGIPRDVLERALDNSVNFVALHQNALVGFARVATDRATFAWLCDVFVLPAHRGKGEKYGFSVLAEPQLWMAIRRPYRKP